MPDHVEKGGTKNAWNTKMKDYIKLKYVYDILTTITKR